MGKSTFLFGLASRALRLRQSRRVVSGASVPALELGGQAVDQAALPEGARIAKFSSSSEEIFFYLHDSFIAKVVFDPRNQRTQLLTAVREMEDLLNRRFIDPSKAKPQELVPQIIEGLTALATSGPYFNYGRAKRPVERLEEICLRGNMTPPIP